MDLFNRKKVKCLRKEVKTLQKIVDRLSPLVFRVGDKVLIKRKKFGRLITPNLFWKSEFVPEESMSIEYITNVLGFIIEVNEDNYVVKCKPFEDEDEQTIVLKEWQLELK